jgi:hypothetical protein
MPYEMIDATAPPALRCVECAALPEGAAIGWRPYISGGFEGEPLEVGVYCPYCAAREFADEAA